MPLQDTQLDFGELRSLLHKPASRTSWARLCTLIESWTSTSDVTSAVDYTQQMLSSWPAPYRLAPLTWTLAVCRTQHTGEFVPWRLVRALDLSTSLLAQVELAHMEPLLAPLEEISLDGQSALAIRFITALLPHELPLKTLHIHHWGTSPTRLTRQLANASLHQLRTLSIAHSRLDHEAIDALLDSPWLAHIERLELPNNLLHDHTVELLLARMPRLMHLNLSGNQLSLDGVRALLHSTRSPPLHTLLLNHNAYPSPTQTKSLFSTPLNGLKRVEKKTQS